MECLNAVIYPFALKGDSQNYTIQNRVNYYVCSDTGNIKHMKHMSMSDVLTEIEKENPIIYD